MKNKSIELNKGISVDIEKLIQSRMVILANSGSGKSWAIRRIAEQAVDKVQTIILDPEGEFASLREKHDFILCGKGADVPVETRSATLLATKLLEIGKSAVIDLYELHPQERQRFVKLFCDALVNAPKELYHPVLIILDEAHDYVPEGKPSEATYAVEALASKGRKRGQCLILASQRISKLSKNASAECNNKLIGRASQDIDYMRAGAELGFDKEGSRNLKTLKPGSFYAFGPAISDGVELIEIGPVKTTHAKVGYKTMGKVPAASDAIKNVLAGLKDLPQEAEREATTVKELKEEIKKLRAIPAFKIEKKVDTETIEREIKKAIYKRDLEWEKIVNKWTKYAIELETIIKDASGVLSKQFKFAVPESIFKSNPELPKQPHTISIVIPKPELNSISADERQVLTGSEQKILNSLAWCESIGMMQPPQDIVAFLSGYSHIRSTGYRNPRSALKSKGLVDYSGGSVYLTEEGRINAEAPDVALSTERLHQIVLEKLDGPERKILTPLLDRHPEGISNMELASIAGYEHERSTGYRNPRSRLKSFGLIEYQNGVVRAKDILFI